jgi:hypothetical protein
MPELTAFFYFELILFPNPGEKSGLVAFTCIRERLILGLVIVSIVAAEVETFVPSIVGPHLEAVRSGHFAASLLALLVSLSMLVKPASKAGAS